MQDVPLFEGNSDSPNSILMLGRKLSGQQQQPTPPVESVLADEKLITLVPVEFIFRYQCIPLEQRGPNTLVLGMVDPVNHVAIDDFRLITGFDIEPVAISPFDFAVATASFRQAGPAQIHDCVLTLTGLHVQAQIVGPIANVSVRQTFHNPLDEMIEAVYIFPLSPRAAVHQFRLRVGDRIIEGEVQEKGQARKTYEAGRRLGHRSALMEQQRDNVFTTTIGNIPPGESLSLELVYAERLEMDESEVTFRFPLVVAPRYFPAEARADSGSISPPLLPPGLRAPGALSLELEIAHGGLGLARLTSTQHAVSSEMDIQRTLVRLTRQDEALNRDFVLRFRLGQDTAHLLMSSGDTFLLCLTPPAHSPERIPPRDVVIILDRSGSMGGSKMLSARRAVQQFLGRLGPDDRFAIMAFDDELEPFQSGFLHPVSEVGKAQHWLNRVDARGGTEILRSIRWLVDLARSAQEQRYLSAVLITDGQVGNEAAIYAYLQSEDPPLRLYTLGVDSAVNEAFLRQMARLGRGTCELVTPGEPLERALDRLSREVSCPLIVDLQVLDAGLHPVDLVPDPIPDLYAARPVFLLGRHSGEGDLIVRGRQHDQEFSVRIQPQPCVNPALPLLWARQKIQNLQDRLSLGDSASTVKVSREITELALRYGLVSDHTSFVLVDRDQVINPDGVCKTSVQPVELPAEWSAADAEDTLKDICAQDFGPLDFEDVDDEELSLDRLKERVDEAPIVRLVNLILGQAANDGVEVIYVVRESRSIRVEYEVNNLRYEVMSPPTHSMPALIARLKSMANLDLAVHDREQSGYVDMSHEKLPFLFGITITLSPEGREEARVTLEPARLEQSQDFGLDGAIWDQVRAGLSQPHGMLQVVGSGASSWRVFAALLQDQAVRRSVALWHGRPRPEVPGLQAWEPDRLIDVVGFSDLDEKDWLKVRTQAARGAAVVLSEGPAPFPADLGRLQLEWEPASCPCATGCQDCRMTGSRGFTLRAHWDPGVHAALEA